MTMLFCNLGMICPGSPPIPKGLLSLRPLLVQASCYTPSSLYHMIPQQYTLKQKALDLTYSS